MKKTLLLLLAAASCQLASAQFSIKKPLLEEHTGAWCGYCPDGGVIMNQVLTNEPNAVGVAWHNGDAMTIPEGDELGAYYITGYPMATIDRTAGGMSRNLWMNATSNAAQGAGIVTVAIDSLGYDISSREITVRIKATFTGSASGDMRFNCIITEDNIEQTGAGYNQTNYYNTTAGHTYYGAGDPIIGYNHRHVVRAVLGTAWGTSGIIPNSVSFGTTAMHTYTYTLPANYDESEIHIVGLVSRYDGSGLSDREVLNSEEMQLLTPAGIANSLTDATDVQVYPNPFGERMTLSFDLKATSNLKVEVLNPMGQVVYTIAEGIMNSGMHSLYWNGRTENGSEAANGLYFIRLVSDAGQVLSHRVNLVR
jgi:Outer membrane protein Omp28/FlgD Ig-like domain